jgi:formiminotetrahydrofolate cyclodeaminase
MTNPNANLRLTELKLEEFLALLSSKQPAPGGGSAAALAGAMAAALTRMATQLTVGRAQYAASQEEMLRAHDRAEALERRLAALVDEDALAYQSVISACSLPKATEMEAASRAAQIQLALRRAAEVPREAAEACAEVIELAASCTALGNRNTTSDAGVAALLAHAGMRGAALTVRTNLNGIQDETFTAATEAHLSWVLAAGETALPKALAAVGLGE